MTEELTKSDAELAYKYMNGAVRGDVEYDAYDSALNEWADERPDDLETLEAAHEDDSSPFVWENIELTFERSQVDGSDELTPHTTTADGSEEVHELARDFGWDYVGSVRDRIRALQESTQLSPREFVALVLSESKLTYNGAASEMDIKEGTFASKMSREVSPEVEAARETVQLADRLSDD